jgi:hypothetical protein
MWVITIAAVSVLVLGFTAPRAISRRADDRVARRSGPAVSGAQATTGRVKPDTVDVDAAPATIREIETITGAVDGHELIGRPVDLDLTANGVTSAGAFWVGPRANQVLVAPSRALRQQHPTVREGQRVTIRGMIDAVPDAKAKDRLSWGLTAPDLLQLSDQKIYIRADRLIPE